MTNEIEFKGQVKPRGYRIVTPIFPDAFFKDFVNAVGLVKQVEFTTEVYNAAFYVDKEGATQQRDMLNILFPEYAWQVVPTSECLLLERPHFGNVSSIRIYQAYPIDIYAKEADHWHFYIPLPDATLNGSGKTRQDALLALRASLANYRNAKAETDAYWYGVNADTIEFEYYSAPAKAA